MNLSFKYLSLLLTILLLLFPELQNYKSRDYSTNPIPSFQLNTNINKRNTGNTGNTGNTNNKKIRNVTPLMKKIVAANQRWTCNICHNILQANYEVDHIIPLYKGGMNDINNLQALCRNCHGNKTFSDLL